jgi:hypothetical protein
MHDEVSETENIRKNLSIERQIAGGCEELLDVTQVFIRQGLCLNFVSIKAVEGLRGARGKTFPQSPMTSYDQVLT